MAQADETMTKARAAEYIGVSVRTLLRLTGARIAHLPKRRPADETQYSRGELDRYLAQERAKAAGIVSGLVTPDTDAARDTPENNGNSQALVRRGREAVTPVTFDTGDALDTPEMRLRMLAAFEAMASPVRLTDKLMLTLTEAALLAGLSRGHLRTAIGAGNLQAKIIGRGWRVKRADLDRYVAKL